MLRAVFRPWRTLVSLAFIAALLWCSFRVQLGRRTFAEHMDRIGQTPEAEELLEGTRSVVNPMLQDMTERLLGEHIEAPTAATHPASAVREAAGPPPLPSGSGG